MRTEHTPTFSCHHSLNSIEHRHLYGPRVPQMTSEAGFPGMYAGMWRPEVDLERLPYSSPYMLRQDFLLNLDLSSSARLTSQLLPLWPQH